MDDFAPVHTPHIDPLLDARLRNIERFCGQFGRSAVNAAVQSQGVGAIGLSAEQGTDQTADRLPESRVIFSAATGHAHEGIGSAAVALTGDVTGFNTAATVVKLEGVSLPAPAAGDDLKFVRYLNTGPTFGYVSASVLALLGAWQTPDISLLAVADAEILNSFAADTVLGNVMPAAGALVGIAIRLSGDVGAAGNNLTATGYKNAVATTVTATVTGAAGVERNAFATFTPVVFAAGDLITVQAKLVGVPAAVRAAVQLYGYFV